MRDLQGRRPLLSAVVIVGGIVLAGCGGGGSDASDTTAKPSRTTTTASATTTAPKSDKADAATQALAEAGTLRVQDFGPAWTLYSKNNGNVAQKAASSGCGFSPDSPFLGLPFGAIQSGPTVKMTTEQHFVGSSAFAFADEADAKQDIAEVNAKAWATCKRGELQKFQDDNVKDDARFTVELDTRIAENLGKQGFESYARFAIRDTKGNVVGYTEYSYYRVGRVVIRVQTDTGAIKDQEAFQKNDDLFTALTASYSRLNALQKTGTGGAGG